MTESTALARTLLFALFNALTVAYEQGQEILTADALHAMCLAAVTPFVAAEEQDWYAQRLQQRLAAAYEQGGSSLAGGAYYLDAVLEAVEGLIPTGVALFG